MGVEIGGNWLEEVVEVKNDIFNHFRQHFQRGKFVRPHLAHDFARRKISAEDSGMLIAPFSKEEIKKSIWSCASSKSLGPDGFNFHFLKEFWHLLKSGFLSLFLDFHTDGKLVRVLIPRSIC